MELIVYIHTLLLLLNGRDRIKRKEGMPMLLVESLVPNLTSARNSCFHLLISREWTTKTNSGGESRERLNELEGESEIEFNHLLYCGSGIKK
jgi:hypothetical protein